MLDDLLDLVVNLAQLGFGDDLIAEELAPEDDDGVLRAVLLDFFFGPVLLRISHRVAPEAVGDGLKEERTVAFAAVGERFARGVVDGEDVLPVNLGGRDTIGHGLLRHVAQGGGVLGRRAHAVQVVLTDVERGQLPQPGHVQRLVERAIVRRAVAESAHGYALFFLVLARKG